MVQAGQIYEGDKRRLVLAFDVGTTFSGVSYCLLNPGDVISTESVTRWPGQEHEAHLSKTPTVIYYDDGGKVKAAGAETILQETIDKAEEEGWHKVDWFKLRLRPKSIVTPMRNKHLRPLPSNKTVVEVFGDFLSYLMSCAEKFIRECDASLVDDKLWSGLKQSAVFILGHPNGWEGAQQAKMRKAAIYASLIPDTPEGWARLKFVTEGEASLNFCLRGKHIDHDVGEGFIIADLGGGTLDFSAYELTGKEPLNVREVAVAKCNLEGSIFVNLRSKAFVQDKLKKSRFGTPEIVNLIVKSFNITKKTFKGVQGIRRFFPFGTSNNNDEENGIRKGKLAVEEETIASFFEPAIKATVESISAQIEESSTPIHFVYLVGGFSANSYLLNRLKERLNEKDIHLLLPDKQTEKAVAEGAISFFVNQFVTHRVAKHTYGTWVGTLYDSQNIEHEQRKHLMYCLPSGKGRLSGFFSAMLKKGASVSSQTSFTHPFWTERKEISGFQSVGFLIDRYIGNNDPPTWKDQCDDALMQRCCTIAVDFNDIEDGLERRMGQTGVYYYFVFSITIEVGAPEMTAYMTWADKKGVEHKTRTQIIYDGDEEDGISDEDEEGDSEGESDEGEEGEEGEDGEEDEEEILEQGSTVDTSALENDDARTKLGTGQVKKRKNAFKFDWLRNLRKD